MLMLSISEYIMTTFIICLSFYCLMAGLEKAGKLINKFFDWSIK